VAAGLAYFAVVAAFGAIAFGGERHGYEG